MFVFEVLSNSSCTLCWKHARLYDGSNESVGLKVRFYSTIFSWVGLETSGKKAYLWSASAFYAGPSALCISWSTLTDRFKFRIAFGYFLSFLPIVSGERRPASCLPFSTCRSGDTLAEEAAEADTSVLICKEPCSYCRRLRVASRSSWTLLGYYSWPFSLLNRRGLGICIDYAVLTAFWL